MRWLWVSSSCSYLLVVIFFFFNDTATTEIYTLSLHDALPIYPLREPGDGRPHHVHARGLHPGPGGAVRPRAGARRAVLRAPSGNELLRQQHRDDRRDARPVLSWQGRRQAP